MPSTCKINIAEGWNMNKDGCVFSVPLNTNFVFYHLYANVLATHVKSDSEADFKDFSPFHI